MNTIAGYYFCVFSSANPEPGEPLSEVVYLRNYAEARYLENLFAPLYDSHGIAILISDDEVISGINLSVLANALRNATRNVKSQPESWPVAIGHEIEPYQVELGQPILEEASRSNLLAFLEASIEQIEEAVQSNGYLHWGGDT